MLPFEVIQNVFISTKTTVQQVFDRQTDRQADRQTDRQTVGNMNACCQRILYLGTRELSNQVTPLLTVP